MQPMSRRHDQHGRATGPRRRPALLQPLALGDAATRPRRGPSARSATSRRSTASSTASGSPAAPAADVLTCASCGGGRRWSRARTRRASAACRSGHSAAPATCSRASPTGTALLERRATLALDRRRSVEINDWELNFIRGEGFSNTTTHQIRNAAIITDSDGRCGEQQPRLVLQPRALLADRPLLRHGEPARRRLVALRPEITAGACSPPSRAAGR